MTKGPEAALQAKVLDLAKMFGWHRMHTRAAYQPGAGKWMTPLSGEKGYPDLTLVRPPRLVFAELKSDRGYATPEQKEWLALLDSVPGVEVYLWKPRDLEDIAKILGPNYQPEVI